MKVLVGIVLVLAVPYILCYDEKYDKIDADKIINDDKLFSAYLDCMLDRGPCTLEYSEDFKKLLPEVIATSCEKCSPVQRQNVRKTVRALTEKRPDDFKIFRDKFDPKGEYEKDFTAFFLGSD
ncbi:hypothetical protein K1T71_010243 [Dendrolimus kikuchii]|uniref:Uncharacterized protein n=1 Tax=Dendrolimus kikuchii TaxID=765133 RepID=A0ACC1CS41_9NEOP|nr:hypothetical protein K1T71_010243 [Dendrolimus kikuchii]